MQGNTLGDLHTIPLHMLCSVQCMFHEHSLKFNDVAKERRRKTPVCAIMFSLLLREMPLPAHALRARVCGPRFIVHAPALSVMPAVFGG